MNKRKLFIFSFCLICVIIMTGGLLLWYSEQLAEQKLRDYIRRLKDEGFTTEEHSLADFQVEGIVEIHFFGDFRSFARQEGVNHIYFDRGIHALYFLRPMLGDRAEADVFYYK